MKFRKVFPLVVFLALSLPLAAPLAGKKIDCAQIGKGLGYFLFFYHEIPMFEKLNPDAVPVVQAMAQKALQEKLKGLPGIPADLSAPPASLTAGQAVSLKLGGLEYSFQAKPMAEAMAKTGSGLAYGLIFYSTNIGPKDANKPLSSSTEELPAIELDNNGQTVPVFNFISMRLSLLDSSGKEIARGKEAVFSYRDWFNKKYPEFMSGQSNALPEGVTYNSASQYALFISDSMQAIFDALSEHKTLVACPRETK